MLTCEISFLAFGTGTSLIPAVTLGGGSSASLSESQQAGNDLLGTSVMLTLWGSIHDLNQFYSLPI